MKALITGVTGYIGSRLAEVLEQQRFEVFGMARTPFPSDNKMTQVIGNLANPDSLAGIT